MDISHKSLKMRSGKVRDNRALVAFLYVLMRDHVTPSNIEEIMSHVNEENKTEYELSNGYLAMYAKDLATRLHVVESIDPENHTTSSEV